MIILASCPVEGQVFRSCGGCQKRTCNNPNAPCPLACFPGCACPTGQVIDTVANKCVSPSQCPVNCSDVVS